MDILNEEWYKEASRKMKEKQQQPCNFEKVKAFRAEDTSLRVSIKMNREKIDECEKEIVRNRAVLDQSEPSTDEFNEALLQINMREQEINDYTKLNESYKKTLKEVQEILKNEENKCGMKIP